MEPQGAAGEGDEASHEARALELLGFGFLLGDGTRLLEANEAAARIFGRSVDELISRGSVRGLLHPEDEVRIAQLVEERLTARRPIPERFAARVLRPNGEAVGVELRVKAEVQGDRVRTFTLVHETTEAWAVRKGLAQLALTDPLTGLANRLALEEHLGLALARLDEEPGRALLLFLDIDGLKAVNDDVGHWAGDEVLRAFADRLAAALRHGDTAARLGGDEFVALVTDLDDGDPTAVIDRIREATTFSLRLDGEDVAVQASVGAVVIDDPQVRLPELIARADERMYEEKVRRRAER